MRKSRTQELRGPFDGPSLAARIDPQNQTGLGNGPAGNVLRAVDTHNARNKAEPVIQTSGGHEQGAERAA